MLTGIRLCLTPEWRAGTLAAAGSAVAMVALLGLTGMIGPSEAGQLGRWIGTGVQRVLGGAGAGAALVVVALLGIILATDLRTGIVIRAMGRWFAADGEGEGTRRHRAASSQDGRPRTFPSPTPDIPAELTGVPMLLPFETPKPGPPPLTAFLDPEEPQATGEDVGDHGFTREFEGVPAMPSDVAVPTIGPVPEVGLGHAAMTNDEPEKVWVLPTAELLDTITGKRERLAAEVRATGDKIVSTLQSFGIETRIVGANSGPTVTQYELQPGRRAGQAHHRLPERPVTRACRPRCASRRPSPASRPWASRSRTSRRAGDHPGDHRDGRLPRGRHKLALGLGNDVSGQSIIGDLTRMPHLLIAGATGRARACASTR